MELYRLLSEGSSGMKEILLENYTLAFELNLGDPLSYPMASQSHYPWVVPGPVISEGRPRSLCRNSS